MFFLWGHDHLGVAQKSPAMSKMAGSLCLCCDLAFVLATGFEDYGEGFPKWSSSPLKHSAAGGGAVGSDWCLCRVGYSTRFLRCSPWWPDVDRCIGGRALSLSGDDDSAALPPSGVVALSEPDPEMTAMLSRAAENVGLVWNPPPRADPSRLDEWFLGGGRAPLRCHSFQKCMRSLQDRGRHLSLPEINLVAPPPSPPSMVEPLWGTWASPLWSGLWPCNCVQQPLPLYGVNCVSPHGPVSIRQALLAVLIEPVGRRLLPYTPWRYCRSIRPKHWETCTRVVTIWQFYMSCVLPGSCVSTHTRRNQVSVTLHTQTPAPAITGQGVTGWLILAQSCRQLCAHRDLVLKHLSLLGLWVNWEKSKLMPTQRISFLGMELDSVNQTACLTQERAQSVLNCFKTLSGRTAVALNFFLATVPLGLLHMRPLQHWLHGRIPMWAWKRGTHRVQITPACRKTFSPWSDPSFLQAGVPLEQVSRHAVVFTDASATEWGATYNGHAVSGVWTGSQLRWHINCLELLAVRLALSRLRGRLQRKDVLVRTDNTATIVYINRQGGLRSHRMSHVACCNSPATSSSGVRSIWVPFMPSTSQECSIGQPTSCLEQHWTGGSADLGTVQSCSGGPVCISRNHPLPGVLLPNRGNARHGCTGTQLAPVPAQICVPPSEPTSTDQGGRGAGLVSGSILAQHDLVPGTHVPRDSDSPSLADSSEKGSAFSEMGQPLAPASGPVETPRMVPGCDADVLGDLLQEVALTIASARAPSTRRAYALKWNLFIKWCSSHQDPRRCSIRAVLSFLQQG